MEVIFETERLYLRRFTPADANLILELNSDPEVLKYLHEPLLTNKRHALTILQDVILPQYQLGLGRWAIHLKSNNDFAGWCGLKSRPEPNEIDLGYRLKRSFWNMGIAAEVAKQSLDYGFKFCSIPEITGRADINNKASIRILEKIGMKFCRMEIIDDQVVRSYKALLSEYTNI